MIEKCGKAILRKKISLRFEICDVTKGWKHRKWPFLHILPHNTGKRSSLADICDPGANVLVQLLERGLCLFRKSQYFFSHIILFRRFGPQKSQKSAFFSHFGRDYLKNTNFPNYMGYASIERGSSAKQSEIYLKIVGAVFEKNTENLSKIEKCHFCPFWRKIRGKCYPWRTYWTQQPTCWYIYWRGGYVGFEKKKKNSHIFSYFVGSGLKNGKNRPFLSHFGRDYRKNTNFPSYKGYTSLKHESSTKRSEILIKFVGAIFEQNTNNLSKRLKNAKNSHF